MLQWQKKRRPDKRYYRLCPVPGCRAKPQARLALHLTTAHPSIKGERRLAVLRDAVRLAQVPGGGIPKLPRPKGQPTLHQLVNRPSPNKPSSDEEYYPTTTDRETAGIGGEQEAEGGTRRFPKFDLEHLRSFEQYLLGIDGGNKSPKNMSIRVKV